MNNICNYSKRMLEIMPEAFACFRLIADEENKPVGFILLEANSNFEKLIGVSKSQLEGKLLKSLLPDSEKSFSDWIDTFGKVALSGKSSRFEIYNEKNEHWYEITAFSYEPGFFTTLFRNITEFKVREDKTRHASIHDWLTGLFNRYYLEVEMQRLDTERQLPFSIVFADLNNLKLVNDTFGYSMGDIIIKRTAEIISKACRKEDIVCRWGGDEYVILLPQTDEIRAREIIQRINNNCKKANNSELPISLALGVAVKTRPGIMLNEVREEAEEKMYAAKLKSQKEAKISFFNFLYTILQEKCFETEDHIQRMRNIALKIGKLLNLSKSELKRLTTLVMLHDIGKVKIVEDVLAKNGKLSREEWAVIKEHPETGYRVARATEEFRHLADEILSHHEHWDGSGYPRGLKGEAIPLLARIAAIADAYEVMTCDRPYKKAVSPHAAFEELKRCAGAQFDPQIVKIVLSMTDKKEN